MRKKMKIWLVIAASLVLMGCIVLGGVMMSLNWDWARLSTVQYETSDYAFQQEIHDVSVVTDTADVTFIPSDRVAVTCYEQSKIKHKVTVQDGTLLIQIDQDVKWYEQIGINLDKAKITVYLPAGAYGSVHVSGSTGKVEIPEEYHFANLQVKLSTGSVTCKASVSADMQIKTSTGAIRLADITAGSLELTVSTGKILVDQVFCDEDVKIRVSTGKVTLTKVTCKNLHTNGNTGDLIMTDVIASESFRIERTTGDVSFSGCDAQQILVKTDTGDVTGTLCSGKVFVTKTDTGKINVPITTSGGLCEITTDTGDIRIRIAE